MKKPIFISFFFVFLFFSIGYWYVLTQTCQASNLASINSKQGIPECLLLPGQALKLLQAKINGASIKPTYGNFQRLLPIETSHPVNHVALPQHPLMAKGGNNMHNDAYISDVNSGSGPRGINTTVRSRTQGFGGYGTLTFDSHGRIVTVFGNARSFQLELLDPNTLEELTSYDLPPRSLYFPLQGVMPWKYLGAGMYFYLNDKNQVVLPTTDNKLVIIQTPENPQDGFTLLREYDLNQYVVKLPWPKLDSVAWVMPEWPRYTNGIQTTPTRYWYATIQGLVGVIDAQSGEVLTWKQDKEIIENSFAVGEEGIFMMTDYAMYRLNVINNKISVQWREGYDRGPARKAGHITRGSGTSVTLVGSPEDGLVAATDNAEPKIHLELYRRSNGEKVCRVPLFADGESGTDLSAIAFQHASSTTENTNTHYSVMIENNFGHHSFPTPDAHPGIVRVDAFLQSDGTYNCKQIWQTEDAGISGAKLSLSSGLLYMHTVDNSPAMGNYFTAIDFATGKAAFHQHTGMGHGYNTWQGVLFLHPDNGALYGTSIFGLIKIQDQAN